MFNWGPIFKTSYDFPKIFLRGFENRAIQNANSRVSCRSGQVGGQSSRRISGWWQCPPGSATCRGWSINTAVCVCVCAVAVYTRVWWCE